jgi:RND superfamily putative drug exporter
MGKFLHKIGEKLFEKHWWTVGVWLLMLLSLGGAAYHFYKPISNALSISGVQSQVAIDRLGELFPNTGKGSGRIVFHTTDKKIDDYKSAITLSLNDVKNVDGITRAVSPFDNPAAISGDGKTAYAEIQLKNGHGEISKDTLSAVAKITDQLNGAGLQVERGGDLVSSMPDKIIGFTEMSGLLIALMVLILTFGSLAAAGMPIISALVSVATGIAGLFALSQVVDINFTTPILAAMLGLAVGIDYSLFIISKYRSLLLAGHGFKEAAGRAVGTAGNAVVFAAGTVIIALVALSVVRIPFMTIMGLSAAATIAFAALVAITLTPSLLGIFGKRLFSRRMQDQIATAQTRGPVALHETGRVSFWHRWGESIVKHPFVAIIVSLVIVGLLGWPVSHLQLGLPTDQYSSETTTQRKAYNLISDAFGPGSNAPLIVIVENLPPVTDVDRQTVRDSLMADYNKQVSEQTAAQQAQFQEKAAKATTLAEQRALQQEMAAAKAAGEQQKQSALAKIDAAFAQYAPLYQLNKIATPIAKVENVKSAVPAMVTSDGIAGLIQVIPDSAPSDSKTSDLISYLRDNQALSSGNENVSLVITGTTALQDDINQKLSDALPVYLAVVVGLSLILLLIAFRSILIPIKATIGFLLSVFAMFGSMVAIFQLGRLGLVSPAPIVSFIPIVGIGILFGLAMDYEFFLVSSMHESFIHTHDARKAIITGFSLGAQVVTAAAIIMVAVFAGFIGNHDTTIKSIGFGLAVGILVDAFVVRMTFVPAVMALLGKSAWWLPKWLNRILPRWSIEGEEE